MRMLIEPNHIADIVRSVNLLAITNKDLLTSDEACIYLGIQKSTLDKLTSERAIGFSKPRGKLRFFKKEELDTWAMSNPICNSEQINLKVTNLLIAEKRK